MLSGIRVIFLKANVFFQTDKDGLTLALFGRLALLFSPKIELRREITE